MDAIGIIPAAGGSQTLPRTMGGAKALDMLLTTRRVSGQEAYRVGLVNRLVTRNRLFETAEQMAKKITACDPSAVRCAKQAVIRGLDLSLSEGLRLEKRFAYLLATPPPVET